MHPELLQNSQFLRYYEKWQKAPDSVAFIPVAEYFLKYNMVKESLDVCKKGLLWHPQMVSARLLFAKILIKNSQFEDAAEELQHIFMLVPDHPGAKKLLDEVENIQVLKSANLNEISSQSPWCTATMAKLYASQGKISKAKEIYTAILEREPNNAIVQKELVSLESKL